MTTLIFGKDSNLSRRILSKLENSVSFSTREIVSGDAILEKYNKTKINLIFNNFQTSTKLNDLSSPKSYIEQSIYSTSVILELIRNYNINKIVYISSSSVYGNNKLCNEGDRLHPGSLHASLKVANEELISMFCLSRDINYTIARVFNMYGGEDKFSVIHKIINVHKESGRLELINNGSGIRDFIHIDDVVRAVINILEVKDTKIINIGTGAKKSIRSILDFLESSKGIRIDTNNVNKSEIPISIADNRLLEELFKEIKFIRIEDYMVKELGE